MRHLFDQYSQPQNRVTHALASALGEEPRLLRQFVRWSMGASVPKGATFEILEQRLPGEPEVMEEESERRGLPDMWIHDNDQWDFLVESKVASRVSVDQLRRHYLAALLRGYTDIRVIALGVYALSPSDFGP